MTRPMTTVRFVSLILVLALVVGLMLWGCGGRSGGLREDDGKTAAVSGSVFQGEQDHKLKGALVSLRDATPANTTTTDSKGSYSLTVPVGQPLVLQASAAGLLPSLNSVLIPAAGQSGVDLAMVTRAYIDARLGEAKMPATDTSKGLVVVIFDRASGGEGASLSSPGDGSMTVHKTTDKGVASKTIVPGGSRALVFSNVATGSTKVTLAAPGCKLRYAGITSYPVVAGALSMIEAVCP